MLLHFFQEKTSVDVEKYEKRLEKYPKVVLATNNYKMVTMLVNQAKKQDPHAYLKKKAKESALKAKFSANPDAPEEQTGTIIYTFLLK